MDNSSFIFTPENVSKYWNLLNNSNNPNDKKIANDFLIQFKKNCPVCLEISFELFKSQSLDDKLISSCLIYQYLKENQKMLLNNKQTFIQIKSFILDNILIPYTNQKDVEGQNNIIQSKTSLIIERICYAMSILIVIGISSYWSNAIDDMLSFGKNEFKAHLSNNNNFWKLL